MNNLISVILFVCICSPLWAAECTDKATWSDWIDCKIRERVAVRLARDATIRSPSKQESSPAIASNSTSLVDQTSAPDLLGFAMNLAKLSSHKAGDQQNSFSISTSAYALYAAANKRDPLDPGFYVKGRNWRRASFTVGREVPDDASSGPAGTILGTKLLIVDHRDLATKENIAQVNGTLSQLSLAAAAQNTIEDAIQQKLGLSDDDLNNFPNAKARVASQDNDANEIIDKQLQPFIDERALLRKVFSDIKQATQWSANFQVNKHDGSGGNDYRAEMALDLGPHPRINLTANAGFIYSDSKTFGMDRHGGRFAAQAAFRITEDAADPRPIIVTIASEGKWQTMTPPSYQVQGKTSIPLMDGIEIPLSVTWANRTDLIKEEHVRARFGFTFDVSRLATRIK